MTRYSVDADAVLSAADHARATIARIHSDVHTLNAQLNALGATWTALPLLRFSGFTRRGGELRAPWKPILKR